MIPAPAPPAQPRPRAVANRAPTCTRAAARGLSAWPTCNDPRGPEQLEQQGQRGGRTDRDCREPSPDRVDVEPGSCTTFVHRGVGSRGPTGARLWTALCTQAPAKLAHGSTCGPSSGRTRTSSTATPEGHQDRGNSDRMVCRIARPTGERWTFSMGQPGELRMAPQVSERTGRLVVTDRSLGQLGGWSACIASAGLTGPGNRTPRSMATRGPSDAYSEGPSLCPHQPAGGPKVTVSATIGRPTMTY